MLPLLVSSLSLCSWMLSQMHLLDFSELLLPHLTVALGPGNIRWIPSKIKEGMAMG